MDLKSWLRLKRGFLFICDRAYSVISLQNYNREAVSLFWKVFGAKRGNSIHLRLCLLCNNFVSFGKVFRAKRGFFLLVGNHSNLRPRLCSWLETRQKVPPLTIWCNTFNKYDSKYKIQIQKLQIQMIKNTPLLANGWSQFLQISTEQSPCRWSSRRAAQLITATIGQ